MGDGGPSWSTCPLDSAGKQPMSTTSTVSHLYVSFHAAAAFLYREHSTQHTACSAVFTSNAPATHESPGEVKSAGKLLKVSTPVYQDSRSCMQALSQAVSNHC